MLFIAIIMFICSMPSFQQKYINWKEIVMSCNMTKYKHIIYKWICTYLKCINYVIQNFSIIITNQFNTLTAAAIRVVSHYHSFQHSEWQIEVQTHCWRANWRAKWGSQWHSPLQFFSALCPPYTLHQSLLWSHTGRLYAALKMSPD